MAEAALDPGHRLRLVVGGATRRDSVFNALRAIVADGGCAKVLVHDAARPFVPIRLIDDLIDALGTVPAAIPVLPVVDTLVNGENGRALAAIDRSSSWRVQTPQAFDFATLVSAHQSWPISKEATDDASMVRALVEDVAMVTGDSELEKFTYAEDFADAAESQAMIVRSGSGFDVHRLVPGRPLWLGGVLIPHDRGLDGHSDADVVLHAITDAILGAIAKGDIGDHFPPSDARWKNAASDTFLEFAMQLLRGDGWRLSNIDVTIICEAPKIKPHREAMRERIAAIMQVDPDQVSVKATTSEGLGFAGRGEGIAAQALATVQK
jgi:2-C-methyl-D-erythritol 4-phosphate cytidylyltransferase/2-C-methyl-D-erythritol 2,4-cyclodiphosphate synthase